MDREAQAVEAKRAPPPAPGNRKIVGHQLRVRVVEAEGLHPLLVDALQTRFNYLSKRHESLRLLQAGRLPPPSHTVMQALNEGEAESFGRQNDRLVDLDAFLSQRMYAVVRAANVVRRTQTACIAWTASVANPLAALELVQLAVAPPEQQLPPRRVAGTQSNGGGGVQDDELGATAVDDYVEGASSSAESTDVIGEDSALASALNPMIPASTDAGSSGVNAQGSDVPPSVAGFDGEGGDVEAAEAHVDGRRHPARAAIQRKLHRSYAREDPLQIAVGIAAVRDAQRITIALPAGYYEGAATVQAGKPVTLTFKLEKDAGCGNT
ncbi:MAG: hypothetical protein EOO41_04550, partial [Methanobacteriota archaeon]